MMKFLKMLATPFVAIWRWIKETAWVQPLLIVGCIFAVIFSIPYISQGIQNLTKKDEDALRYYKENLLSMNGAYKGTNSSEAGKFLSRIDDLNNSWIKFIDDKATAEEQKVITDFKADYGEKFFFVLAKSNCEACEGISEALEYLQQEQSYYQVNNFELHTIIADEKLTDDEKEYKTDSAFKMIYDGTTAAFESLYRAGKNSFYINNLQASELSSYQSKLDTLHPEDISTMEVPMVALFDLTEEAKKDKNQFAVSQLFYSLKGEDKITRAKELADCWLYRGETFQKEASK